MEIINAIITNQHLLVSHYMCDSQEEWTVWWHCKSANQCNQYNHSSINAICIQGDMSHAQGSPKMGTTLALWYM